MFIDGWAMVSPGDPALAAGPARRAASVGRPPAASSPSQRAAALQLGIPSGSFFKVSESGLLQRAWGTRGWSLVWSQTVPPRHKPTRRLA
jgi:hypothetical protein